MKYLYITEYSLDLKYKIPERKNNEFDLIIDNNLIRTTISNNQQKIKENFDYIYDESKLDEKVIPLNKVIIYDDIDMNDEEQEVAYVYICPICQNVTITDRPNLDFCTICENTNFPPELYALINLKQMEDIAINNSDISEYIQIKDDEIVFKDAPEVK